MKELSQYILHFIKKNFQNGAKPPSLSDETRTYIQHLYKNIKIADTHWKSKSQPNDIQEYTYDFTKDALPQGSMYSYINPDIRQMIESRTKMGKKYTFTIRDQMINAHIVYPFPNTPFSHKISFSKREQYFKKVLHKIYLWLFIANQMKQKECSQELNIYIYMTDLFKTLPDDSNTIIDEIHANTAFTTSCSPKNEIHVFREEEWFKVFIHETFHSFGMDFSHVPAFAEHANQKIKEIFPVNVELSLFETFSELFANNMNILFYLYMNNSKNTEENIAALYEKHLYYEQLFSCFQCSKVLHHSKLTYADLYQLDSISQKKRDAYKENTNVIAYHVLKSIYIWNMEDVYRWVLRSNKKSLKFIETQENLDAFLRIFMDHYKDDLYLNKIHQMENWFQKNKYKNIENITLCMSVHCA